MANSSVTALVQPGGRNGGNAKLHDLLGTDQLPWAMAPSLTYVHRLTLMDLRTTTTVAQDDTLLVGGTIVQGDHSITFTNARTGVELDTLTLPVHDNLVTIAGTASDGNYDVIFASLSPPVRARVTRATTPATNDNIATAMAAAITDLIATQLAGVVVSAIATTNTVAIVYETGIETQDLTTAETTATGTITASTSTTAANVATGLEALIAAARATTLAGYVDNESVLSATVTVNYEDGVSVALSADFPGTSTATITPAVVATIPLGRPGDYFPTNVWLDGGGVNVVTALAGVTTITAELGDDGDPNGLMTSTTLASAGFLETIAAAEFVQHIETAYEPQLVITANEPLPNLTAGELEVHLHYVPLPTI